MKTFIEVTGILTFSSGMSFVAGLINELNFLSLVASLTMVAFGMIMMHEGELPFTVAKKMLKKK